MSSSSGSRGFGNFLFEAYLAPFLQLGDRDFWSGVLHGNVQDDVNLAMLFVGVVAEPGMWATEVFGLKAAWRAFSNTKRSLIQGISNLIVTGAQLDVSSTVNHTSFLKSLEVFGLSIGTLELAQHGLGLTWRSHMLRGSDVARRISELDDHTVLVYRVRSGRGISSPILEAKGIGIYHEEIVAVSKRYSAKTHITDVNTTFGQGRGRYAKFRSSLKELDESFFADNNGRSYQYIGEIKFEKPKYHIQNYSEEADMYDFFNAFKAMNPGHHLVAGSSGAYVRYESTKEYSPWSNNCHDHVTMVIDSLRETYGLH